MPRSKDGLARLIEREGTTDARIVDAFRKIDRALFVPPGSEPDAYGDYPVKLPEGQTTSQPSLIARMIAAAAPTADDVVLEIGAGYGFQTALLAVLAKRVVAIERWANLAGAATRNLERAAIDNATVVVGDGYEGEPRHAPYDAIVVSAAADEVPAAVAEQLAESGRLVIPLRAARGEDVVLFVKRDGKLEKVKSLTPARFVPLVRNVPLA